MRNPQGAPLRALYLVNDNVKAVMDATDYKRIRLVSAGVKLFGRSELAASGNSTSDAQGQEKDAAAPEGAGEESKKVKKLEFRILSDGLTALLPHLEVSKLVAGGANDLRVFLKTYYPLCSSFEDGFRNKLEALGILCPLQCIETTTADALFPAPGSHIVRFAPGDYGGATYVQHYSENMQTPLTALKPYS